MNSVRVLLPRTDWEIHKHPYQAGRFALNFVCEGSRQWFKDSAGGVWAFRTKDDARKYAAGQS